MKKYLSLLFLVLSIVLGAGVALAQDQAEVREMRIEREAARKDMQLKREEVKAQIETTRSEAKQRMQGLRAKLSEEKDAAKLRMKEARIVARENMLGRFDAVLGNLARVKERVSEAVEKASTSGIDTTKAEEFLVTAGTKLTDSGAKVGELNALLSKSVESITAEDRAVLKTLMAEVHVLFKETREALRNTIVALKESVKESRDAADAEEVADTNESDKENEGE